MAGFVPACRQAIPNLGYSYFSCRLVRCCFGGLQYAAMHQCRSGSDFFTQVRNSSLKCQSRNVATIRPSSCQQISRPSMTTVGTRCSSSGSLSTVPRRIKRSFSCGPCPESSTSRSAPRPTAAAGLEGAYSATSAVRHSHQEAVLLDPTPCGHPLRSHEAVARADDCSELRVAGSAESPRRQRSPHLQRLERDHLAHTQFQRKRTANPS
jgi:hypothetical protein